MDIQYYLEHWNTNVISLSVLITLVFLLAGYFYGCALKKLAPSLKKVDTTFLGFFTIIALFQLEIFWSVSTTQSTNIAYTFLIVLLFAGPVLCLLLRANILPGWRNLFSLLLGVGITIILCAISKTLTTNNVFFDSITYLSETVESSVAAVFGNMAFPNGVWIDMVDPLHDYQGYYYLFGMIMRYIGNHFAVEGSLTPIYIWSATMLYGMCIGGLIISSANVLFPRFRIVGVVLGIAILAPYYTNYFNTTLAFFGNTIRPIMTGFAVLVVYLIMKEKEANLFLPLTMIYLALLCATSSGLFISAFITAGLFFYLIFSNESNYKMWMGFSISCFPIFLYALLVLRHGMNRIYLYSFVVLVLEIILCAIIWFLRNHFAIVHKIGKILFPIVVVGLVAVSILVWDTKYGHALFWETRSLNDMTLNYTSHVDQNELYRNIILYGMLLLMFVNPRFEKPMKWFLVIVAILFLNPLVQPAISNYLTTHVYSRAFDIIVNPFTIIFLIYNIFNLIPRNKMLSAFLCFALLIPCGLFSLQVGYKTATVPYSITMVPYEDDYNWETKVTDNSFDMYTFIEENLANEENRPWILSQDVGLKGYVPNISISFSSTDFRSSLDNPELFEQNKDIVTLLYPGVRLASDNYFGEGHVDFSRLKNVVHDTNADYLILNNTAAVWNERGWWEKSYYELINGGLCEIIYENPTWVVMKIINRE